MQNLTNAPVVELGAGYFNLAQTSLDGSAVATTTIRGRGNSVTKVFLEGTGIALSNAAKLIFENVYVESSGGTICIFVDNYLCISVFMCGYIYLRVYMIWCLRFRARTFSWLWK
jgi:hypothetical protein